MSGVEFWQYRTKNTISKTEFTHNTVNYHLISSRVNKPVYQTTV